MKRYRWTLQISEVRDTPTVIHPKIAGTWLAGQPEALEPTEHFGVLLLDTRNKVIGKHTIAVGTLNGTLVHPREVFCLAIHDRAAGLILFHNHPSGNVSPSDEDRALTRRLVDAGQILGIEVLDHIILSPNGSYLSFKEKELM